jgi:DnaJ-class molecular chaperone
MNENTIDVTATCPACHGTSETPAHNPCPRCEGFGEIDVCWATKWGQRELHDLRKCSHYGHA